jgi:hypothetical protein
VYREKLPARINVGVPLDTGIAGSTNFALFELRWQTSGMFLRGLESTNDLGTSKLGPVAFTLLRDQFCFLDGGTNAFFYQLEHERARRGNVPPAYDAAYYRVSRYGEILNLGVSHLWPGSIQWEGDRFIGRGIADKRAMHVFGEISQRTNGLPCELSVTYSNSTGLARYRIAYAYDRRTRPFFPSRISLFFRGPEKEVEFRTYEVLSLRLAQTRLPDSWFSPDSLVRSHAMSVRYFTNNSVYARLPSGLWLESRGPTPRTSFTRQDYYRNRYFYVFLVGLSGLFLGLAIKSRERTT